MIVDTDYKANAEKQKLYQAAYRSKVKT